MPLYHGYIIITLLSNRSHECIIQKTNNYVQNMWQVKN